MPGSAKVIHFPTPKRNASKGKPRNPSGIKYFNEAQIRLLRRTAKDRGALALERGQVTGVREWMLIDMLTSTGVREAEAADLRCGDLRAGYGESAIFIRNGKGSKARLVQIPDGLKRHLKSFIKWKADRGEPTGSDDHLFIGQRGPWTSQAVQQVVKGLLKSVDLYEAGKSAHALRHSYAVQLYRQERDLRAVQKQLGHSSIQTTQIYADVTEEDIQGQIKGLWG